MILKEILLEFGRKKGLTNKEHIEKAYFQDIFLFALYKKTNKLIFKGGTALYKLYALPRFSEDLDFSLIEDFNDKSLQDIIKEVVDSIKDFKIKSIKKTKDSLLIKISCKGILTDYNTLRIDINFKNKVIDGFDVKTYVPDFIDINPFALRSLKLEEIISEKIHSLYVRSKARDLFDLFFLLRISSFNRDLVQRKLKIFNLCYDKRIIEKNINNLKIIWEKELRPFILTNLPSYEVVKEFVLNNLK